MGRHERGFTILEVILFLAVSGLLFVMIFGTINGSLRNARFSASVKGLQQYFVSKYASVQTGGFMKDATKDLVPVCSPSSAPTSAMSQSQGKSDTCLALGMLLDLGTTVAGSTKITAYPLLGFNAGASGTSAASSLTAANVQIWNNGSPETYELDWSAELTAAKKVIIREPASMALGLDRAVAVRYIAFVRDVESEALNIFAFNETEASDIATAIANDAGNSPSEYRNLPTLVCFKSNDAAANQRGIVLFNGSGTGRGTNVGNITSVVAAKDALQFTKALAPYPAVTGYAGVTCGN